MVKAVKRKRTNARSAVLSSKKPKYTARIKQCKKCGEIKVLDDFYRDVQAKDGHRNSCKVCLRATSTEWRIQNPEKRKQQFQSWYMRNAEKAREYARQWRIEHQEKQRETNRQWYLKNQEYAKGRSKDWRKKNRNKHIENAIRWRKENPEKAKEYAKITARRIRSTSKGKLNANIKRYIGYSLHGSKRGRHWETLVGYTVDNLKKHLERQFKRGMTWENYGTCWHIDHKIPITVFNFKKPEDIDFKRCWALNNLQPMWAKENISKGTKLNKPFQPSLGF